MSIEGKGQRVDFLGTHGAARRTDVPDAQKEGQDIKWVSFQGVLNWHHSQSHHMCGVILFAASIPLRMKKQAEHQRSSVLAS